MLPLGFPPATLVHHYCDASRNRGVWQAINHYLLMTIREEQGRQASPTPSDINRQSVKTTESDGIRGYDAGRTIKGRKRHVFTDIFGLFCPCRHPRCRHPGL